ncbi:MAG: HAD family hydrolase, partial [Limisphaerales bacterium]
MAKHSKPAGVVFLFDVDNTLLDNDRVIADLRTFVRRELGRKQELKYWSIFEQLRSELGYADYLGALQRYRQEHPREPNVLVLSQFMIDYPFANRLFPGSLDALEHANHLGRVAILSDGDVVFQPRKVQRSGLGEAVMGQVLIYVHKEEQLADVAARLP